MPIIDGREWAPELSGKYGITEKSLRYKIKDGREFLDLTDYNIQGHLQLKNFYKLRELNCSSPLKKYYEHPRNNITSIDLSGCSGLKKLNCSSNVGLTVLNIRNCSNLVNINVVGCLGLSKVICDNTPYSPEKIIEQTKMSFCLNDECQEVAYYDGYCKMHRKHCCKEEGCNSQISISKEYCSNHKSICKVSDCFSRAPLNSDCVYHQKEKEKELKKIRREAMKRMEDELYARNQLRQQIND
ncbi:26162_t:CDS:1, partial [Gigaspora rosea]